MLTPGYTLYPCNVGPCAQGYLFLVAAQYRRWSVPRAKNDSEVDVFFWTAVVCVIIAYVGYAAGMGRAVGGHLHLAWPGTLLPTFLAIFYSAAGALVGASLFAGAVLGSHWCHVIVQEVLPTWLVRWLRQPERTKTWERFRMCTSLLGVFLGPFVGAAACLLLTSYFLGLLLLLWSWGVLQQLIWWAWCLLVAAGRLAWHTRHSGVHKATKSAVVGTRQLAVEKLEKVQDNKDGFDRKNYQQVRHPQVLYPSA